MGWVMSAQQRMRLEAKERNVAEQLKAKEPKLASSVAFHSAAWDQYGSELCAGDMSKKDQVIRDEIKSLEDEVDLLDLALRDQIDFSDEALRTKHDHHQDLGRKIKSLEEQLSHLRDEKNGIEKELRKLDYLRSCAL